MAVTEFMRWNLAAVDGLDSGLGFLLKWGPKYGNQSLLSRSACTFLSMAFHERRSRRGLCNYDKWRRYG